MNCLLEKTPASDWVMGEGASKTFRNTNGSRDSIGRVYIKEPSAHHTYQPLVTCIVTVIYCILVILLL